MTDLAPLPAEGDPYARPGNQEDTMKPYTDADVLDLQDVIADARIRGIGNGTYSMARAILEAGYRLPAEHHLPLLALDAEDVASLVTAAAMEAGTCPDPRLLAALAKIAEATRD